MSWSDFRYMKEENVVNEDSVKTEEKVSNSLGMKIWKVIRIIFLGITSPIWFPWKVLFVRKKGRKFNEVDSKTKVFRVVRGFVTKPLKFCIYLLIISLEVVLIYKARFSVVTYSFTKSSVHEFYLKNESDDEWLKTDNVAKYSSEFEKSFGYIDEWSLGDKNKMYVILNSDVAKLFFERAPENLINDVFSRFNNDKEFRENTRSIVSNVNSLISRGMREIADTEDGEEILKILGPAIDVSSYAVDYAIILDAADKIVKSYEEKIVFDEEDFKSSYVDAVYEILVNFNNGKTMEEAIEIAHSKYDF